MVSSGQTKYLIDANAVRCLSFEVINSKCKSSSRIIATTLDVKHEVFSLSNKLDLIHIDVFTDNVYIKTKEILKRNSVRDVIDYYNNKGAADVMLLAHALTSGAVGDMFKDKITIVTNDLKLRTACDDLDIIWMSIDDFRSI